MVVSQRRTETEVHVWLSKWASCYHTKDWPVKKVTKVWVGHVTTISGHFFANYIKIFHKTEVLTVILRCITHLNLNWIKSYDINHKCFRQLCFSILEEKKTANLSFKNGHFSTISGHFFASYINIFHKTEVQTVNLRCLVCLNLNWIKSYDILLVKIFIFSCLKMHHFRGKIPK